jgi:DNA-binding CsgD family transcriptional regulator
MPNRQRPIDATDSFAAAMVLVDETGRVHRINAVAHALVCAGGLTIEDGCLVSPDINLLTSSQCRTNELVEPSHVLRLGHLHMILRRLPDESTDIFGHTKGWCAVSITGPMVESLCRRLHLITSFAATRAEAAVGDLLTQGLSIGAIAGHLQRTPATVRTHLKRLFEKTSTSSQSALIALIDAGYVAVHKPWRVKRVQSGVLGFIGVPTVQGFAHQVAIAKTQRLTTRSR